MAAADPSETTTDAPNDTTTTTTTNVENNNDNNNNNTESKEESPNRNDKLAEFESKLEENEKLRKYSKDTAEKKMARQSSAPNVKATVSFPDNDTKTDEPTPASSSTSTTSSKSTSKAKTKSTASASTTPNTNNNSDDENETRDANDPKLLALQRATSMPPMAYDPCREFDNFAGDWVDSKGQPVIISAWGVIRYPNNPKLRFEAIHMGPNHLSVTFDRDPKKRKFVGKLNHDCNTLIWSNDTKWTRKGTKGHSRQSSKDMNNGNIPEAKTPSISNNNSGNESDGSNNSSNNSTPTGGVSRQGSCIVM